MLSSRLRSRPHRRASSLSLLAALALVAAVPASAGAAGAVSSDGQSIRVTESAPGEANSITVAIQDAGTVEVSDYGLIAIGAGCTQSERDPQLALCPLGAGGVEVATGGGDDVVGSYMSSAVAPLPDGALRVALGDGNDTFHGNVMAEVVDGGAGNDTFRGAGGDDTLDGGAGDDRLLGEEGRDTLRGGDGNDLLTGDLPTDRGVFADTLDGGGGVDTLIDYQGSAGESEAPPISVSFDGVANDGRAGENDNVVGIERVEPSSTGTFVGDDGPNEWTAPSYAPGGSYSGRGGNDVLRGSDYNGDMVDGGAGDDDVAGGLGDDTLTGGPGKDAIAGDRPLRCNEVHCDVGGGNGNDTIQARDGEVDSIACGPGSDRVVADAGDVVAADCETVERAAGGGGVVPQRSAERSNGPAPVRPTVALLGGAKLKAALKSGFAVRVKGAAAKAKLKGALVLAAPVARKLGLTRGKRAVTVARGSVRARGDGSATLRLRFTAAARKRLARAKRVQLTLRVAGAGAGAGAVRTITLFGARARARARAAAASASASSAGTPKYRLTLYAFSSEKSHLEDGDYPEDCASWTVANSTVAFETRSGRTFNLALIRHPLTDMIWGQVSSDLQPTTEVYRYWRFRSHVSPSTEACSPCGPSSEYGECTGETFDDRGTDDCGSDGVKRRGGLSMFVSDRGITVSAYPEADFSRCPEPRQDGLPLGSDNPKLDGVTIPNGTRQLLRMQSGTTRIIKRKLSRGRCGKLSGRGLRVCVETQVRIEATRVS